MDWLVVGIGMIVGAWCAAPVLYLIDRQPPIGAIITTLIGFGMIVWNYRTSCQKVNENG